MNVPSPRPAASAEPVTGGAPGSWPRSRTGRDWAVDVVCFVLAVAVCLQLAKDSSAEHPSWVTAVDLIGGLACCPLLWWRRRWPVAITVLVVSAPVSSSLIVALVGLVTVGVYRRARVTAALTLCFAASASVWHALGWPGKLDPWFGQLIVLVLTSCVAGLGAAEQARRRRIASLREQALRAEREQQAGVEEARHGERARIAHEMRDVLTDRLSTLSQHADALQRRPEAGTGQVTAAAGTIRSDAHQALNELRGVIGVLRQPPEDDATVLDGSTEPQQIEASR